MTEQQRRDAGISEGLLRVAVCAEDPDDLIADFVGALDRVGPSDTAPTGAP
jgi:cystathionine beta-lyase/cystathionine gamma-synthase